jgi:hypothetical protein
VVNQRRMLNPLFPYSPPTVFIEIICSTGLLGGRRKATDRSFDLVFESHNTVRFLVFWRILAKLVFVARLILTRDFGPVRTLASPT